jgi:hypothetical protein
VLSALFYPTDVLLAVSSQCCHVKTLRATFRAFNKRRGDLFSIKN